MLKKICRKAQENISHYPYYLIIAIVLILIASAIIYRVVTHAGS